MSNAVSTPARPTRPIATSTALAASIAMALSSGDALAQVATDSSASPEYAEFDPGFFVQHGGGGIDVSQYTNGNITLPGVHEAQIYLNGDWAGKQSVTFSKIDGHASARLCLDRRQLELIGIDVDGIAEKAASVQQTAEPLPSSGACGDIGAYIPGATADFESGENRLDLAVPQLYLSRNRQGYVAPEHWEAGVNAGFLRYSASTYSSHNSYGSTRSTYFGLNGGLNLNRWHLRHSGSLSRGADGDLGYQANSTYVQRSLPSIQSNVVLGQSYTSGEVFDGVRLMGAALSTDDRMLPDSMTGYAPVVRGIAQSNARVSVRQRGVLIQEINVAAGPFILDDLFPTGSGGDLEVTVAEADGREQRYVVPFASNARLLRPGYGRYEAVAGRLDESSLVHRPTLLQATYQYGLNNVVTGYAGAVGFEGYRAQVAGAAFNTPLGAISLDLTTSQASIPGLSAMRGHSVQLRYNRNFVQSGTNFALGAYRYSTENFLSVIDAAQLRSTALELRDVGGLRRLRDRMDVSLNQQIGRGSIYLTGSAQNYWNHQAGSISYSAGYSSYIGRANYSIRVQRARDLASDTDDTRADLTVSIPLGHAARAPNFSATMSEGTRNRSLRAGINGVFGEDGQFSYSTNASHSTDTGNAFAGRLEHRGPVATLAGGFTHSGEHRTASLDVTGGIVAHAGGLTFTPDLGDTIGLVHVPKGKGIKLNGNTFGRVDRKGYAIMPQLNPFRTNSVELDPTGASHDVELESASYNVAPYAGAVVLLPFKTSNGLAMLIKALRDDGSPLPFGANVFDENGNTVGVVGQAGKAFVRTFREEGQLTVRWGKGRAQQCTLPYALDTNQLAADHLRHMEGTCMDIANPSLAARNSSNAPP